MVKPLNKNRAERTPGAVAVSLYEAEAAGAETPVASCSFASAVQQISGAQGTESPQTSYKDSVANPATQLQTTSCGAWTVVTQDIEQIHHFAKKLYCGKEWCQTCGADNSPAHKRRLARLLPKLQQISQLGYLVIEWPDIYRHIGERGTNPDPQDVSGWCYSKRDLRDTTSIIVNVLAGKRQGRRGRVDGYFKRGLLRWHWFGEKRPGKYNPHLNILVDGTHLDPKLLETIKTELRATLNVPNLIVHYSYVDQPGQIIQKARYITRATFLDQHWSPYMAEELWNFRNMRWWGSWKDEPVWALKEAEAQGEDINGLDTISKLQQGICPDCGKPLKIIRYNRKTGKPIYWSKPVDSTYLTLWKAEEIAGTGYYRIPHQEWTGYSFSPDELLWFEKMEAEAKQKPSVLNVAVLAKHHAARKLQQQADDEAYESRP